MQKSKYSPQILSDQWLRRPKGSMLHLAAIIQRHFSHFGRWVPTGVKPFVTLTVRLVRRKQSALLSKPHLIDRHPLQQLRRPCASSCLRKAARLVVKRCWQCFRVFSRRCLGEASSCRSLTDIALSRAVGSGTEGDSHHTHAKQTLSLLGTFGPLHTF